MFYSITGTVVHTDENSVALDCNGVAFLLTASSNTLRKCAPEGEKQMLYTYLNVREDALDLFGFADKRQKSRIIENVMLNPSLPAITTPYFKLYELLALCECGMIEKAQEYILSYWGGMLRLGATSVWEAYDETKRGDEHFAMYGSLYGKSLCHAWGSGPILLLISKCAGVSFDTNGFAVEPKPGIFKSFRAKAPVKDGSVSVSFENGKFTVLSSVSGGTLKLNGNEYALKPGIQTEVSVIEK